MIGFSGLISAGVKTDEHGVARTKELTYKQWMKFVLGSYSARERHKLGIEEINKRNCERICRSFGVDVDYTLFDVKKRSDIDYFRDEQTANDVFESSVHYSELTGKFYPSMLGDLSDVFPLELIEHQSEDPVALNYKSEEDKVANKPLLRKENAKMRYTYEHAKEYARCSVDILYFGETYCAFQSGAELVLPVLYDYQKELLLSMFNNRRTIALCARRTGKTSATSIFLAHQAMFNKQCNIAILAHLSKNAEEALNAVRTILENLPDFLVAGFIKDNVQSVEFDNSVKIVAFSKNADAARGWTFKTIYIDETAYLENWEATWSTIGPIVDADVNNRLVLTSTPRGRNHFYDIWKGANTGDNGFSQVKALWYDNPRNLYHKDSLRFDSGSAWEEETRAISRTFGSEHLCEFDSQSDPLLVDKEYTDDLRAKGNAFKQRYGAKARCHEYIQDTTVYLPPHADADYIIVADTCHGRSQDYHAAHVFDVTQHPDGSRNNIQVAVFHNNDLTPTKAAHCIYKLSEYYNDCPAFVELADSGELVINDLKRHYGVPILSERQHNKEGFPVKNYEVKVNSCNLLAELILNNKILLLDDGTIAELENFIEVPTRSGASLTFEARPSMHDDKVMACVAFAYALEHVNLTVNTLMPAVMTPDSEQKFVNIDGFGTVFMNENSGVDMQLFM